MRRLLTPVYLLFFLCALLQSACSHIPGLRSDTVAELKLLAEGSDARAQLLLAQLLDEGAGVPRDLNAAVDWYRKSAGQGDPHACFELARLQLSGKVATQNDTTTVRMLFKAGEAGNTGAQALLGALFVAGRGKEEFVSRTKLVKSGADKGDSRAQYTLGWVLREGAGLPRSASEAQLWLTKAAKQGNAAAALLLGDMALNGEAGQKDTSAAIRWFENAAAGNQTAIARLSLLHSRGIDGTLPVTALAPRLKSDIEEGYRRLQLEFAEEQSVQDEETALLAARRLLAFDPTDRAAGELAERLWSNSGTQLTPLFKKAEQQIVAGELQLFKQTLGEIVSLNPDEVRLRELTARFWLRSERLTAAVARKREARREEHREIRRPERREEYREEQVDSGDAEFKKGITLMARGQFDAAAKLFEKLAKTPGYSNVAGAYIYLGIASLARINMSKVHEAKKLRLKGIASFQNALRFDRNATLPDGYLKYRDIFEEASRSLK